MTGRRPDASMSLLTEVMQRPLDPGYAAAAERRRPYRAGSRVAVAVVTVLLGGVLVISVQQLRAPVLDGLSVRQALQREIQQRSDRADRLQAANDALRVQIAKQQQAALAGTGAQGLAAQVQQLSVLTGEVPVTGPGLRVVLDDAPGAQVGSNDTPRDGSAADQGRVLDSDLQILVNGLWQAGAEAIAINGQRLTVLSAIRTAGQAILVDFRPLSPPYQVDAIGPATSMQTALAAGSTGPYLQTLADTYGISVQQSVQDSLQLPGAGQLVLRYARPAGAASSSGSSSSRSSSSGASASTPASPQPGSEVSP